MRHAITLRLPDEYQRRGPELPGIAYFMGDGQFWRPWVPVGDDDPFAFDVEAARDHPQLARRVDIIGQQFALVWLSADELAAGPTPPPPDSRRPGEHTDTGEGLSAWDSRTNTYSAATRWVYLAERFGDPNAGVAPRDHLSGKSPDVGSSFWSPFDWENSGFEGPTLYADHLGGSTIACSGCSLPDGFTPYYLELATPTWGVDYGNGESHLIDLESDAFEIG